LFCALDRSRLVAHHVGRRLKGFEYSSRMEQTDVARSEEGDHKPFWRQGMRGEPYSQSDVAPHSKQVIEEFPRKLRNSGGVDVAARNQHRNNGGKLWRAFYRGKFRSQRRGLAPWGIQKQCLGGKLCFYF